MLVKTILALLTAVALVVMAAVVFRRYGKDDEEPEGVTSMHTGGMISALFLLVFTIALVLPWSTTDEERKNTTAESQALVEAYWDTGVLPADDRRRLREEIRGYLDFVIHREFPLLASGADDLYQAGWKRLDEIRIRLSGLNLPDRQVDEARDGAVERLREAYSARRQRAATAGPILPTGVLVFMAVTGFIMIVFPYLVGARPRGMPLLALGINGALLGISIYLCFDINHAYTGPLAVGPDAFTKAVQEIARIP